jgi:hypothetical protein
MSARIDAVNAALNFLGEQPIMGLDDDSDRARTMKVHYYAARDAMLEDCNWTFAISRFTPAVNTVAPAWGWGYAYTIPSDVVRVTTVLRSFSTGALPPYGGYDFPNETQSAHVIEGNEILSNDTPIYCLGVRKMEDEGGYSPLFLDALSFSLAFRTALAITASMPKQQAALALFQGIYKRAKTRDGQQNTTRRMRNTTMRDSR